jgi:proline dehydrogenase
MACARAFSSTLSTRPSVVSDVLRSLLLALSTRRRIGDLLDRVPATRRMVRRFVAGTTLDSALDVVARVNGRGLMGALTYLGENVATPAQARAATLVYSEVVEAIAARGLRALPSVKLTHLGLDVSPDACASNVALVAERCAAAGTRLWIDMESSAYTERTLQFHARLHRTRPSVACVVQAALRRTPADVERLVAMGAALRLCKGAYREPPDVAYPAKRDVDAAYAGLADRLLQPDAQERGVYVGYATHDEALIERVRGTAAARGVGTGRFEIQMLYGIRHDLHARLHAAGLGVRVLVPFGEDWYGYFMRRLAERPANLVFLLRNLVRPTAGGI